MLTARIAAQVGQSALCRLLRHGALLGASLGCNFAGGLLVFAALRRQPIMTFPLLAASLAGTSLANAQLRGTCPLPLPKGTWARALLWLGAQVAAGSGAVLLGAGWVGGSLVQWSVGANLALGAAAAGFVAGYAFHDRPWDPTKLLETPLFRALRLLEGATVLVAMASALMSACTYGVAAAVVLAALHALHVALLSAGVGSLAAHAQDGAGTGVPLPQAALLSLRVGLRAPACAASSVTALSWQRLRAWCGLSAAELRAPAPLLP